MRHSRMKRPRVGRSGIGLRPRASEYLPRPFFRFVLCDHPTTQTSPSQARPRQKTDTTTALTHGWERVAVSSAMDCSSPSDTTERWAISSVRAIAPSRSTVDMVQPCLPSPIASLHHRGLSSQMPSLPERQPALIESSRACSHAIVVGAQRRAMRDGDVPVTSPTPPPLTLTPRPSSPSAVELLSVSAGCCQAIRATVLAGRRST
jgi:hypothetical protein